jgi:hypothetical protein
MARVTRFLRPGNARVAQPSSAVRLEVWFTEAAILKKAVILSEGVTPESKDLDPDYIFSCRLREFSRNFAPRWREARSAVRAGLRRLQLRCRNSAPRPPVPNIKQRIR